MFASYRGIPFLFVLSLLFSCFLLSPMLLLLLDVRGRNGVIIAHSRRLEVCLGNLFGVRFRRSVRFGVLLERRRVIDGSIVPGPRLAYATSSEDVLAYATSSEDVLAGVDQVVRWLFGGGSTRSVAFLRESFFFVFCVTSQHNFYFSSIPRGKKTKKGSPACAP